MYTNKADVPQGLDPRTYGAFLNHYGEKLWFCVFCSADVLASAGHSCDKRIESFDYQDNQKTLDETDACTTRAFSKNHKQQQEAQRHPQGSEILVSPFHVLIMM